jgi:DNA-binding NtrC family response regulator
MPLDARTKTDLATGAVAPQLGEAPVLVIAYHPDPRFLGARCLLVDGEPRELGRASGAFGEGALAHEGISRSHAEVMRCGAVVRICDRGSRNGTFVNGERVRERELAPGDVVGLGQVLLLYALRPGIVRRTADSRLVGVGAARERVAGEIARLATTETTVLVQGETGTGKELVAAELHRLSARRGALVTVNCGALSDGVLASELFGHARGAFSGAGGERTGLVASAEGGTLLLDEIGDASPALQVSLLRLLEQREVRPVGSDRTLTTTARFVAATNAPLDRAVAEGRFREDLHARLAQAVIELPPLRARLEDVVPLALHFAERAGGGGPLAIARSLALALLRHAWPRNVRELRAVVEALVREVGDDGVLRLTEALQSHLGAARSAVAPASRTGSPATGAGAPTPEALRAALLRHDCNVKAAAHALGVSRRTLYRWLEDAGLDMAVLRRERRGKA